MSHVTVFFIGPAFDQVSVSDSGGRPVGVNVKVRSNAVGTNTDVLATSWAGVISPLPLTETVTTRPPQSAVINPEFFAWIGSAPATGAATATVSTAPARASVSRFISPPSVCRPLDRRPTY